MRVSYKWLGKNRKKRVLVSQSLGFAYTREDLDKKVKRFENKPANLFE